MMVILSEETPREETRRAGSWPRTTFVVAALSDISRNQNRSRRTGAIKNGTSAGVLYEVFTPALAADDTREMPEAPTDSVWRLNLWLQ